EVKGAIVELEKPHRGRRLFGDVIVFCRDLDQEFGNQIDIRIVRNAHGYLEPDDVRLVAPVDDVFGDEFAVRDDDRDVVVGADDRAAGADGFYLAVHIVDLDAVAGLYWPLEKDDKAADKVIGDVLQAKADTDTDGTRQDVQRRQVDADRLQDNEESNRDNDI